VEDIQTVENTPASLIKISTNQFRQLCQLVDEVRVSTGSNEIDALNVYNEEAKEFEQEIITTKTISSKTKTHTDNELRGSPRKQRPQQQQQQKKQQPMAQLGRADN
jgi:hypothetical protein